MSVGTIEQHQLLEFCVKKQEKAGPVRHCALKTIVYIYVEFLFALSNFCLLLFCTLCHYRFGLFESLLNAYISDHTNTYILYTWICERLLDYLVKKNDTKHHVSSPALIFPASFKPSAFLRDSYLSSRCDIEHSLTISSLNGIVHVHTSTSSQSNINQITSLPPSLPSSFFFCSLSFIVCRERLHIFFGLIFTILPPFQLHKSGVATVSRVCTPSSH